ncbi:MAG: DUF790 family protein [Myxococcota bacterium]|nr:DUF790 family protein [Myxococcota bacterium]
MLTADLVRTRMQDGRLEVRALTERTSVRARDLAEGYLTIYRAASGLPRRAVEEQLNEIEIGSHEHRLSLGLRKLIADRATFEMSASNQPDTLRRQVFECAAKRRKEAPESRADFRSEVLGQVASSLEMNIQSVEDGLYSDLREAHRLVSFSDVSAQGLVDGYEMAQQQAILLKARHIIVRFSNPSPGPLRAFFRALKFRRLLYTIEKSASSAYVIRIDGPHSLFRSNTKYGLQLALVLPAIHALGGYRLEASVEWFKEKPPVDFVVEATAPKGEMPSVQLSDDVEALMARFKKRKTVWKLRRSRAIIHLPGRTVCVPDLTFVHEPSGWQVEFEVLGFWSRSAVWKRIELAQGDIKRPVVFAVSERLRVSDATLAGHPSGRLYVYKGVMNAAAVERVLESLRLSVVGAAQTVKE